MLLCSCCDSGWHLSRLQPALEAVPDGEWLCGHAQRLWQPAVAPPDEHEVRTSAQNDAQGSR